MRIKLDHGAYLPERAHATDAGMDLRTPYEVIVQPALVAYEKTGFGTWELKISESCLVAIDTGVHIEVPHGYYGKIETKSGLNRKNQIVCLGGIVDEGYTGSIVVMVYNMSNKPYTFKAGDKIAQIVFIPYGVFDTEIVNELGETDRGGNGFGSTGR